MRTRGNKEFYEWADFEKDSQLLAGRIKESGQKFTRIYGIPRGGLMPAVCLSHLLSLPLITDTNKITPWTLVVDDIVDTGKTLLLFKRKIPFKNLPIASLYYYKKSVIVPQFWIREKTKWVIFPWETPKSSKYDFTLND